MPQPQQFDLPLAKAEYLLTRAADPGQGGDKQNFWQNILGFPTAEAIQQAILAEMSIDLLEANGQNEFGDLYQASIRVTSPTGMSRQVLTIWMVRFGEEVARFVTAVPDRKRRQS
jgi:hypothetical protein